MRVSSLLFIAPFAGLLSAAPTAERGVQLSFFRKDNCDGATAATETIRDLDKCFNLGEKFRSVSMNASIGSFEKDLRLKIFTDSDCNGTSTNVKLTDNANACFVTSGISFTISERN